MSPTIGPRIGLGGGSSAGPIAGVTYDVAASAAAGRYVYFPASAAEWTLFIAAQSAAIIASIAVPGSLHTFQESSGSILDKIGTFDLTPNGGPTYQQAVTGYTRKACTTALSTSYFINNSASLPDPASGSLLSLVVSRSTASAGTLYIASFGTSAQPRIAPAATTGLLKVSGNNGSDSVTGSNVITGAVKPISLRYNRTATTITGFSDTEKLSPPWTAAVGKQIAISVLIPNDTLYAAHWFGEAAEVSNANWKALLQALGWEITWS